MLNIHIPARAQVKEDHSPQSIPSKEQTQDSATLGLTPLYLCRQIDSIEKRVTCYDLATDKLAQLESQDQLATLDADAISEIKQAAFGYKLSAYSQPKLREIVQADPLKSMDVSVKKIERYLSGYVITLDNKQVWEQFGGNIKRVPKGKLMAQITLTPTGNYKMSLINEKSKIYNIRVRRVR